MPSITGDVIVGDVPTAGGPIDPLSEFRLDGEVAVITGGASGIGKAVAEAFAAVGAHVAIFDPAATGDDAYPIDVTDEAQVKARVRRVVARHGRLDVLFNNAGIAIRKPTSRARRSRTGTAWSPST